MKLILHKNMLLLSAILSFYGIAPILLVDAITFSSNELFALRKMNIDTAATDSIGNVNHKSCWTIIPRGGDELETGDTVDGADNDNDADDDTGEDLNIEVKTDEIEPELKVEAEVKEEEAGIDVDVDVVTEEKNDDDTSLIFAASKVGDGSESDEDGLPNRYLRMQKGHREKAKAAFAHTVQWREEHDINTILQRPHPLFDICKRIFPVYIPGRDVSNNIVVIQRVGMIDLEFGKHNNITGDDLLFHYVYLVEYCWNILEPGPPDGVMTTVMDLKNVRLKTFRDAEIRNFLIKFVKTMSDHYPQRSHKTLIINAPSWVNMAYRVVKPILRESTKKKITLYSGGPAQDKALIDILGKDIVPRELLTRPLPNDNSEHDDESRHDSSKVETEIRLFVSKCFFFSVHYKFF